MLSELYRLSVLLKRQGLLTDVRHPLLRSTNEALAVLGALPMG